MPLDLNFFGGRRVFVTGHTGFKGSWISQILVDAGAHVMGYSLDPSTKRSHFEDLGLTNELEDVRGDIRDAAKIKTSVQKFQPDIVLHLAAQALVRDSYADPAHTFSTNVMGAVNILDAVRDTPSVRSLVFVTSDKCYENVEWIWGYRENDPMGGSDPYSASKGAAELVFSSYQRSYLQAIPHLGAASVRAGNVIGGGDWSKDRIVPDCIRAFERDEAVHLRNPLATRPWQHVLEPISGYLLLAQLLFDQPDQFNEGWNFGPATQQVVTVEQVATHLSKLIGKGRVTTEMAPENIHEAQLLQLNCDKAHQRLQWYPKWSASQTIEQTAAWYSAYLAGQDVKAVTKAQIADYFST